MKLILDNIVFALQRAGGISVVWFNLIKHITAFYQGELAILQYNDGENIFRKVLDIPQKFIIQKNSMLLALTRYFSPIVNSKEKFIFHSSYYRVSTNKNAINVTTVHDFTYEYFVSGLKQKIHVWQKHNAIRKSDYIVCISENTKKDLLKFLPDVTEDKIRIIYNGVSDEYFNIGEVPYPEYQDYILFVGNRAAYKNFEFTVKAVKSTRYNLLVCGVPLDEQENELLRKELGNERFKVLSGISNAELNKIYNSVMCLSYPSAYEGFGLPVIEAQKAGCPVIAYNASSIPEVIGDSYPMMQHLSIEEFTALVQKFSDKNERQSIISCGLGNSARFSWDNMCDNYMHLYEEIAQNVKTK